MNMSKPLLLALAASYATLAEHLTLAAEAQVEDDNAALNKPAPRPTAAPGKAAAPAKPAAAAPTPTGGRKGKPAPAPSVDFAALKEKLMRVVKEQSKEYAVASLQRFGVEKMAELSDAQYDEFDQFLDTVLDGTVDPTADAGAGGDDDDLLG